jgi:hypothetical protein
MSTASLIEAQSPITHETNEQYHASEGLSSSGLKHLVKTPRHYMIARQNPKKETASQRLGTLEHMALLEPDRLHTQVKIIDGNRNANAVKAAIEAAEAEGFYVCKSEEFKKAELIAKGVLETSDTIKSLLTGGVAEQSIRAQYKGVTLKCRTDYFKKEPVIVDVKTFTDLSLPNVQRHIHKMKYHWQSYFYLKVIEHALGIKTTNFVHVFVDVEGHCGLSYVLDDAALEKAGQEVEPLIEKYIECQKSGIWHAYPDTIINCSLPHYGFYEE